MNNNDASHVDYYGFVKYLAESLDDKDAIELKNANLFIFDFLKPEDLNRLTSFLPRRVIGKMFISISRTYGNPRAEPLYGEILATKSKNTKYPDIQRKIEKWLDGNRVARKKTFDNLVDLLEKNPNVPKEVLMELF